MRLTHGLQLLVCLASAATLVASAGVPRATTAAADRQPPAYLQPIGGLVQSGVLPMAAVLGELGTTGVPPGTPQPPKRPDPKNAARQLPLIAQYQGAPGTLRPVDLATLALEHGCAPAGAAVATAVAMAESSGSPSAQGDIGLMNSVWDWSAGLWQIRGLRAERGTGELRDSIANQNVDHNAAAMHAISLGCTDWAPWTTYNDGAYLQFSTLAEQAVHYVLAYYAAHGRHFPPVSAPDPAAAVPSQAMGGTGQAPAAQQVTHRPRHRLPAGARTSAPRTGAGSSSAAGATPTPTPAPTSAAAPAPSSSTLGGPLPVPTTPLSTPSLPTLPLPTTSLPLPLPTLTLPQLP